MTNNERDEFLERLFPNLAKTGYLLTSPETDEYNCIAWAAEDNEQYWDPAPFDPDSDYYWPENVPRELTLGAYIKVYETLGYIVCNTSLYEKGFQKVAIYFNTKTRQPTHVARQLNDGTWTSKLGKLQDITHYKLEGLEGGLDYDDYGEAIAFMKRPFK